MTKAVMIVKCENGYLLVPADICHPDVDFEHMIVCKDYPQLEQYIYKYFQSQKVLT